MLKIWQLILVLILSGVGLGFTGPTFFTQYLHTSMGWAIVFTMLLAGCFGGSFTYFLATRKN